MRYLFAIVALIAAATVGALLFAREVPDDAVHEVDLAGLARLPQRISQSILISMWLQRPCMGPAQLSVSSTGYHWR